MEKNMENEMETGIIGFGYIRVIFSWDNLRVMNWRYMEPGFGKTTGNCSLGFGV